MTHFYKTDCDILKFIQTNEAKNLFFFFLGLEIIIYYRHCIYLWMNLFSGVNTSTD